MKKNMRLFFESLEIKKNAHFKEEKGTNGIELTLHYPIPGAAAIKTVRSIELVQDKDDRESIFKSIKPELVLEQLKSIPVETPGKEIKNNLRQLVDGDFLEDLKNGRKWKEVLADLILDYEHRVRLYPIWKLLFRQTLMDRVFLRVQVTAVREITEFEKLFMNSLFGGVKKVAATVEGFVGLTGMTTNAVGSILDSMTPKDKSYIIAEGITEISLDDQSDDTITIKLFCPETRKLRKPSSYDDFGKITGFKKIIFTKGEPNGSISLKLNLEKS